MNINSEIYNLWFNKLGIYNSNLYEKVFKKIPKNSKILDVGIGTGLYLTNCANIIKEKNISIDGIDIDEEYIKSCKNEIKKNSLGKYVKAHIQNLLTYKLEQFDYVIFIQSYPVINNVLMKKMLKYLKNNLSKDVEIIFVHNLVENKNILRNYMKPRLKYITGVDFGKLETHDNFDKFLTENNMHTIEKKCLYEQDLFALFNCKEFMIKAKFK